MTDVYRKAASIMLLRPVEVCDREGCRTVHQFLLLHKPRKNDAWQLPQGGVEGEENDTEAALRELKEEAGIGHCTPLGTSARVYQYDFPPSFRRFRPDNVCGQRIAYVFALAPADPVVRVDAKEVDSYAWADLSQLPLYIHRKEYVELLSALYEEALGLLAPTRPS